MAGNDMAALRKRLATLAPAIKEAAAPALEKSGAELVAAMKGRSLTTLWCRVVR